MPRAVVMSKKKSAILLFLNVFKMAYGGHPTTY
jgi:hypothetical protein